MLADTTLLLNENLELPGNPAAHSCDSPPVCKTRSNPPERFNAKLLESFFLDGPQAHDDVRTSIPTCLRKWNFDWRRRRRWASDLTLQLPSLRPAPNCQSNRKLK